MKNNRNATLLEVLNVSGLKNGYIKYLELLTESQEYFMQNNVQKAYNKIYCMWASPDVVPALLLRECFYLHKLVFPNWHYSGKIYVHNVLKPLGDTRPIVVPNESLRICMGVVNAILQSSCVSWSERTTGFRPGYGTQNAVNQIAGLMSSALVQHNQFVLVSFDIKKAFNSVKVNHLFNTLALHQLPDSMKKLIWNWQHLKVSSGNIHIDGLAQGFAYSPTLFAWYIDKTIVQQNNFVAYADNFAGVFANMDEANKALNGVHKTLHPTGLSINPSSLNFRMVNLKTAPYKWEWLGHSIQLPLCTPIYQSLLSTTTVNPPSRITVKQWQTMLKTTNWLNKVRSNDWRDLKNKS